MNQLAQPDVLAAWWLHYLLYSLYYEVMGGERESNKSDRLKSVTIPSQDHMYRADIEFRKDWNYALSSKKWKKAQKLSDFSHSKEIHSFHVLTFLPLPVQANLYSIKLPFPCCVFTRSIKFVNLFQQPYPPVMLKGLWQYILATVKYFYYIYKHWSILLII